MAARVPCDTLRAGPVETVPIVHESAFAAGTRDRRGLGGAAAAFGADFIRRHPRRAAARL
ncbi:MAG: hypothetical protein JNL66_14930 [Alphaproteobacteria bacterium]|nr:hypothetical protein [Alphaproteobacteria bacterium]